MEANARRRRSAEIVEHKERWQYGHEPFVPDRILYMPMLNEISWWKERTSKIVPQMLVKSQDKARNFHAG